MENHLKKKSINIGIILGVILSLIATGIYVLDYTMFFDISINIILFIIIILSGVFSIIKSKTIKGGTISFKEAFKSYFRTVAIGYLIYWIWVFIIFNIINTQTGTDISDLANDYSLSNFASSYCFRIIQYSFIGIIISLLFSLIFSQNKTEK
ncbi:hypothetical protein OAA78_02385 [Flavobacteriaceae bacterium]|nr:hypothetical protein [Flavobacteriaceae bacterium]